MNFKRNIWSLLLCTISLAACNGGGGNISETATTSFSVSSTVFSNGGTLPTEYTCDATVGSGISPPLSWKGIPDSTKAFALLMTTPAGPGDTETIKYNWVMYNIPASTTSLLADTGVVESGVGTFGVTSDGSALAYAPPCSQGAGLREYTFTIYAVESMISFSIPESQVTGDLVSKAISEITVGASSIVASYTRY